MIAALAVVAVALLALPRWRRASFRRLPPAEAARTGVALLAGGLLALWGSLVLAATPTLLRAVQATGVASICEDAFGGLVFHSPVIGLAAFLAAAWIAGQALRCGAVGHRARGRARVEPWLGRHEDRGKFELVVLPTSATVAVGIPGAPPQVLVSAGLWEQLGAEERDTVVNHEWAHLRLGHHRYLVVLNLIECTLGRIPFVATGVGDARRQLEEWADEVAVAAPSSSRFALVAAIEHTAGRVTAAGPFTGDHSSRIERLERRVFPLDRLGRVLVYLPAVVLALSAAALVTGWFAESHHALAFGGYCTD